MSRGGVAGPDEQHPAGVSSVLDTLFDPHLLVVAERDAGGVVSDLRCVAANLSAAAAMQQPREAIVGGWLGAFLGHPARDHLLPPLVAALERREALALDGVPVAMGPDGAGPRRLDLRAVPVGDGLMLSWRDVTQAWEERRELHEARTALAASEEHYRLIAENASDIVARSGPDGRLRWVSPSIRDVLGHAPDDLLGHSGLEFVHPDDLATMRSVVERIDDGEAVLAKLRFRHADGSHRWMLASGKPILDAEGTTIGRTTTLRDVTLEHLAMEALAATEERFRRIVDGMLDPMVMLTPVVEDGAVVDFQYDYVNPAACAYNGRPAEETLGRRLLELLPGHRERGMLDIYARVVQTGEPASLDDLGYQDPVAYGDRTLWADVRAFRIGTSLVLTWRDTTARHEARTAMLEAEARLEHRVKERTEELETFTYTLSHDLRAPLRWINGFAAMLERRDGDRLDATSRHYLDEIRNASDRMGRLFEELLDYSRMGRQTVRAERIDWGRLTAGLQGAFGPKLAATGGTLRIEEPLEPVLGDPMLLDRTLTNLIDNGLTYTPAESTATVTLRAIRRGDRVRVSVSDEGIGIPPDQRERIFQPFVRLHDADAYPGTGIGLAIVHRAVGLMGSVIHLDSAVGAGTTFWFELPAG